VLDHILLTANMAPALAEVDILHINVDFPYPTQVDFTQVHHASDHEPIRLRIRPGGAAVAGGTLGYPDLRVTLLDQTQRPLGVAMTDALGEFRFWGLQPGEATLRIAAPDSVTLSSPDMTLSLQPGYNVLYAPVSGHQSAALGSAAAWIGHGLAEAAAAEQ
jgi:hypothetical protein